MAFIVADSSKNGRRPLIYQLTEDHYVDGLVGFTNNGRKYRGVNVLMGAIKWANENQIWNCSQEAYLNNGILTLQEFLKSKDIKYRFINYFDLDKVQLSEGILKDGFLPDNLE